MVSISIIIAIVCIILIIAGITKMVIDYKKTPEITDFPTYDSQQTTR